MYNVVETAFLFFNLIYSVINSLYFVVWLFHKLSELGRKQTIQKKKFKGFIKRKSFLGRPNSKTTTKQIRGLDWKMGGWDLFGFRNQF